MRKLSKAPRALLMAALFVTLNACAHVSQSEPTLVRVQSVLTCPPELSGDFKIETPPEFPEGEELVAMPKVQAWISELQRIIRQNQLLLSDVKKSCTEPMILGQATKPSRSEAVGHQ